MDRHEKADAVRTALGMLAQGQTPKAAAAGLGVPERGLRSWMRAYEAGGAAALEIGKGTGRPALCEWPAEDVQAIREIYVRTNLAKGTGSMSMAKRIAVHQGKLTAPTTELLSRPVASKHYIPPSLRRELQIAPAVFRHHRDPRNAVLEGAYIAGTTRLSADGSRRLRYGERFSFDDGSQNQIVCVPWPWGGTREADKFGIRTCRGQWLVAHDDATSAIGAWVFTLRPRDSYRDPDALGLAWRLFRDVAKPDEAVCEGGVWQSKRALAFYRAADVRVIDAKGRPHLKLIENWFNRAWTFLSHYPEGQIGRYRGEYKRENDLLMRCRAGTVDGRKHFPLLPELLREFDECVEFLAHDQIESDIYGKWVPAERRALDLEQHPRAAIGEDLSMFAAPESHVVQVRRGGMALARTVCPLGVPHVYEFADEALMPLEGQPVRVLWDPYEQPVRAAILAETRTKDYAQGDLVCRCTCINPPPAPVAEEGWEVLREGYGLAEGLHIKKALARAVRTEYRGLGEGGRRSETEVRGPDGSVLAVASGAGVADGVTVGMNGDCGMRIADYGMEPRMDADGRGWGSRGAAKAAARRARREDIDLEELERFEAENAVPVLR